MRAAEINVVTNGRRQGARTKIRQTPGAADLNQVKLARNAPELARFNSSPKSLSMLRNALCAHGKHCRRIRRFRRDKTVHAGRMRNRRTDTAEQLCTLCTTFRRPGPSNNPPSAGSVRVKLKPTGAGARGIMRRRLTYEGPPVLRDLWPEISVFLGGGGSDSTLCAALRKG